MRSGGAVRGPARGVARSRRGRTDVREIAPGPAAGLVQEHDVRIAPLGIVEGLSEAAAVRLTPVEERSRPELLQLGRQRDGERTSLARGLERSHREDRRACRRLGQPVRSPATGARALVRQRPRTPDRLQGATRSCSASSSSSALSRIAWTEADRVEPVSRASSPSAAPDPIPGQRARRRQSR